MLTSQAEVNRADVQLGVLGVLRACMVQGLHRLEVLACPSVHVRQPRQRCVMDGLTAPHGDVVRGYPQVDVLERERRERAEVPGGALERVGACEELAAIQVVVLGLLGLETFVLVSGRVRGGCQSRPLASERGIWGMRYVWPFLGPFAPLSWPSSWPSSPHRSGLILDEALTT